MRYCARHVLANKKTKNSLCNFKIQFWTAVRASKRKTFDRAMRDLRKTDECIYGH